MSRRQELQSADGQALWAAGVGILQTYQKVAPTNGVIGYGPGALWFNTVASGSGFCYMNIGGNGFYVAGVQNALSNWIEFDPAASGQFQFGSSTARILTNGNIYRNVVGAGLTPAVAGSAYIVDLFNLPANAFDGTGFRMLSITAGGAYLGSANVTATINIGATTPSVGTVVSGGTTIATTGTMNGTINGWLLQAQVLKYGAANSNTQLYQETGTTVATTAGGVSAPAALTLTENAAIPICITINAASSAANGLLYWWQVEAFN